MIRLRPAPHSRDSAWLLVAVLRDLGLTAPYTSPQWFRRGAAVARAVGDRRSWLRGVPEDPGLATALDNACVTLADLGRDGSSGAPGVVDRYRAALLQGRLGISSDPLDEFLSNDGSVRPGWAALAATVDLLGAEGVRGRAEQVRRLLEDEGVTYGTTAVFSPGAAPPGGGDDRAARVEDGRDAPQPGQWRLDPLPVVVEAHEWAELSAGLTQRAELLDRVLADLYGPRDLLRRGLIPPEVVLAHSGFVRQCVGITLPGPSQLVMAATDVVRGPAGWVALGDRTQAPSGAGYAMENRRVISRVMPGLYRDTMLERLRSFFHALRAALHEVAPASASSAEAPRVVILTPGPASETSFDQAFLSTMLGFPLVEGEDLTVRDGRVWLRSLGRPEPVDVILRRVDGWFCDPLELRADSRLGVPGLLEAARLGHVSIVNPPGSGVLENPGLVPFLPALAERLLGEELQLSPVPTWWCGDDTSLKYVLGHLDTLVLRPIARGIGRANRFGWQLTRSERADLGARIEAEPHSWCAQEAVAMSTAPVMTAAGLERRSLVLRSFAVATGGGFRLMAGGLGRVAAVPGSLDVSSQSGALAKDVWVIGSSLLPPHGSPTRLVRTGLDEVEPVSVEAVTAGLSSRVAEDMFWLGRYAERAEDAARLLRVTVDLAADHLVAGHQAPAAGTVGAGSLAVMLRALTGVTTTYPGFIGSPELVDRPQPELLRLTTDAFAPGTLAHAVRHTVEAAYAVRELLSTDTWLVLGRLDRMLVEVSRADDPDVVLSPTLSRVLEGLLALSGLAGESMVRDWSWYLMDAGRRIERGLQVVSLLRQALWKEHAPGVDDVVLESVLIAAESVITHRRRTPGRPRVEGVLGLLLLDRDNPRSLRHQLERLDDRLTRLPPSPIIGSDPRARLAVLREHLLRLDPGMPRAQLSAFLDELWLDLADLADTIARSYFTRAVPPMPLPATPTVDVR